MLFFFQENTERILKHTIANVSLRNNPFQAAFCIAEYPYILSFFYAII